MLSIRPMTPEDIALGMRLKAEAGWNQTEPDWRRFLALRPEGCFVAEWDTRAVGTVTTCVFEHVGWIGMMLVTGPYRGRGIGRSLMTHALRSFDPKSITSIRLDATPMGRRVYVKLAFRDQFQVIRMGGRPVDSPPDPAVRPMSRSHLSAVCTLDRQAVGADRSALLARLVRDNGHSGMVFESSHGARGYLLTRPGSAATQVGPCIALSEDAGTALLHGALSRLRNENVYVDVPAENGAAMAAAQRAGLRPLRELTRMCRGDESRENVSWLWASSGPEKG